MSLCTHDASGQLESSLEKLWEEVKSIFLWVLHDHHWAFYMLGTMVAHTSNKGSATTTIGLPELKMSVCLSIYLYTIVGF